MINDHIQSFLWDAVSSQVFILDMVSFYYKIYPIFHDNDKKNRLWENLYKYKKCTIEKILQYVSYLYTKKSTDVIRSLVKKNESICAFSQFL